ncbi:melanoma antigen recognized by T-cells 1 isoform X1 [Taeniopygia guttata]|uniref:melanoma antigen recognized by T-cells 1 isoform X1 n=1 Tax=Taeniopygia guttata TaxID=59729 RepID=UPI003BB8A592
MPRGHNHLDSNYVRGKGYVYFAAEEALGIGLFILVLAILLAFGCWYYKRRNGYKSLRSKSSSVSTIRNLVGEGEILDCKMPLQNYRDFNSVETQPEHFWYQHGFKKHVVLTFIIPRICSPQANGILTSCILAPITTSVNSSFKPSAV